MGAADSWGLGASLEGALGLGASLEGAWGAGVGVWLSVSGQMVVVWSSMTVTMVPAPPPWAELAGLLGAALGAGAWVGAAVCSEVLGLVSSGLGAGLSVAGALGLGASWEEGLGLGASLEGAWGAGLGVWLSVSGQIVVVWSSMTVTMVPAPPP